MAVNSSTSPIGSYLYNLLYYNSAASRNKTNAEQPLDDLVSQLSCSRQNAILSTAQFKAAQAGYGEQVAGFTKASSALKTSAQAFTAKDSVFAKKYVTDTSLAVSGSAASGAAAKVYDINVTELAKAQQNEGKGVAASGYGALGSGLYSFGIKVDGQTEKTLRVNVLGSDSNKEILTKIANVINYYDSDVKAAVKTTGDKAYLSIDGKNTGSKNAFTLRDISGSLVGDLELANTVRTSKDAIYSIDGVQQASASNEVKINDGKVTLNLRATGQDKVTVAGDNTKIINAALSLAGAYNEINDNLVAADNLTKRGAKLLSGVQSQFTGFKANEYQKIGITMDNSTGAIYVDTNTLSNALTKSPDSVKSLFAGANGLASAMEKTAQKALGAPASTYLKAPIITSYLDYGAGLGLTQNYYNYSQGLFFDLLV